MSHPPLVSVALCTYNGARHLGEQVESLLAQDWPNLEVVAVDDASTDGTADILQTFAQRDPRLRVFRNDRNLGFLKNFERAFNLTRGAFIAPCDQDDRWQPQKISGLLAALGDHDLAYCDSAFMDEEGRPMGKKVSDLLNMYSGRDPVAFTFANAVSGHALLARRDLVEKACPFPEGCFHDWWLAFVAASGRGITFVPEVWVHYRQHAATVTDLSGTSPSRRRRPRLEATDQRIRWIGRLSEWPGPHQPYFMELHRAFLAWREAWFCPALVALLWQRRRSLYWIPRLHVLGRNTKILRMVLGLRTKRLLSPWRYRDPAPGVRA
ncbi:MAG: glycosyltransferase [Acidobacteria bacterium]|nr:glycosyltransferase [Acidobacteriota bacterium]